MNEINITVNVNTTDGSNKNTTDNRTTLTLRQLRTILPSTEGVEAPTACWFRDNADKIFCIVRDGDAVLTVYTNGFYTYAKPDYPCVLRVDGFKAIRYDRKKMFTETADIPEEEFLDEPFVATLMYRGDMQWSDNAQRREVSNRAFIIDGDEKQWGGLHEFSEPNFLEEMEELERVAEQNARLHEALKQLSNRQKQVVYLRFYKCMTQEEITKVLKIDRASVRIYLDRAITALRGYLE